LSNSLQEFPPLVKKKKSGSLLYEKAKSQSELLLMVLPILIILILFNYIPMFGLVLAFKRLQVNLGIFRSPWVGWSNFRFFFSSPDAWRVTRNTVGMNFLFIFTTTFSALVLALILNEVRSKTAVKIYQTIYFLPYFLSWVVVGYMLYALLNPYGLVNNIISSMGGEKLKFYENARYWPIILGLSRIWKGIGYSSVVYYAGLMGISPAYYEAARIDGATKMQEIAKITIPLISPLIAILLILAFGQVFRGDFGMFWHLPRLQYNGLLKPTCDIIDTYVYNSLRVVGDVGMASAVNFYQAIIGLVLVMTINRITKSVSAEHALY
jgi:putative aldouronate transport system permease protein